jgi:hypothetical protein
MNLGRAGTEFRFLVVLAITLIFLRVPVAQLAITEMMSSRVAGADFFELTNFGTNAIDLIGYRFNDADHLDEFIKLAPPGQTLLIQPNESIILVRTNFMSEMDFRGNWRACFDSVAQVHPFWGPGFSSFGDSLRIYDAETNVVDQIDFGRAKPGRSFVYSPNTGAFDSLSLLENGACLSVTNSTGSPGRTTGPVPLRIVQQPTNVIQAFDLDAVFTVQAVGMPPPRYQWFSNGTEIAGARSDTLVLPRVNPEVEGSYAVLVSNGLSNIMSAPATLTLNRNPGPPTILSAPADRTVVQGRTARFAIAVWAYPPATYQWFWNGALLPDETNRVLLVRNCTLAMSGSSFCVRARNNFGETNACGILYVTNIAPVRITEIQAYPNVDCDGHNDWFEITNFGAVDVQLQNYRFYDHFELRNAQIVKRPLTVRPGESVIFVKNSSPGTFFEWWGPDQVPSDLQVVPYTGFSLRARGDELYLWDDTAEDPAEVLDSISFGMNPPGRTIGFNGPGAVYLTAREGPGVIKAVECGDFGSPGVGTASPSTVSAAEFSDIVARPEGIFFSLIGIPGRMYELESSIDLNGPWSLVGTIYLSEFLYTYAEPFGEKRERRFYRVRGVQP